MWEWFSEHDTIIWGLFLASSVMFAGSLIAVPWLVVRIPADYFATVKRRRLSEHSRHPVASLVGRIAKNVTGILFLLAGIAMLLLPGQGILTMLMGVMLLDFPGKYRFERWIVSQPAVLRSINWLRDRANRPPLVMHP